ncbi:hypothetical protein CR105_03785 [Massilia eurypsychrophila]|uniref:DUF1800 domain-containing protein n=1 Tax=Massilia eurypsychrophila TaxID=1485217 RepID=A0A2G8TJI8_9BURK|nr:DUF1800 domain-containing protein [Massilia eurypsychrophila]PIL46216.1 hypothetical protein CR105_03785 [Massilia eurypsychrophila]
MEEIESTTESLLERDSAVPARGLAAIVGGALVSACGGGGGASSPAPTPSPSPTPAPTPVPPPAETITPAQASRFLAQASMAATREQIARVQAVGYAGWLDEQFALAPSASRWDWLVSKGLDALTNKNGEAGADPVIWRHMLTSPDTLRQRVTLALSEILVASVSGFNGGWKAFSAAAYLDLLEGQAFGNYRTLLQQVSTSAPMGEYLTFRGNLKANAGTGALPDENYAREVMQLFTIGLVQLNLDGTAKLVAGAQQETYGLDDIGGLARVFTGWNYDLAGGDTNTPAFKKRPMAVTSSRHETGSKTFLGTTIAAGTSGDDSLRIALDTIFAHPNVAPFIGRQLILRLVCSNPSPAYVTRVASVFNNDGAGVKGNLKAVVRAILLDDEARNAARTADPAFGKQREPILRLAAWARAFKVTSSGNAWNIGNTSDPASRLGQSPLRASSVFNFFRPGYIPPNSAIGSAGLVAPEFQITNESSVVGYVNFMQNAVSRGIGDVKADYSTLIPLADNPQALLDELNLLLAAGQLSAATVALMRGALATMASGTDAARLNRVHAALVLVLAAPEFIIQK